jgi:SAM-dependent methyltransferase
MPMNEAQAIINRAMSSREAYSEMARREAEVWSQHLVDPRRVAIQKADQAAAAELGLNDKNFAFLPWCKANKRTFQRGLSIGCGAGRAERQYIESGVCQSFHGVDIADDAVAEAGKQAAELGMDCTYEVADINFADFGEAKYDLVVAQTSLHHLVFLEDVFAAIHRAMVPGGILWLHDYVGESQFQHSDLRLSIANRLVEEIPKSLRLNQMNGQVVGPIVRRKPGTLVSPFESIRSGEILPVARSMFKTVAGTTSSSLLHLVVPVGTRANYLVSPEARALFRSIKLMDEVLIETGVLQGADARFVFEKA